MRFTTSLTVLAALLSGSLSNAQRITTTLPWVDGNTLVISVGTDLLGNPTTQTILTVTGSGTGLSSSSSSSSSRTGTLTTPTTTARTTTDTEALGGAGAGGPPTTTTRGRIAADTTSENGPPMRTTTYWFDPGNGVWQEATWTASNTERPTVATAIPPAGTIQDYNQYQQSANSAALSNAEAAETLLRANASSSAGRGVNLVGAEAGLSGLAGWVGIGAGLAGMVWGAVNL